MINIDCFIEAAENDFSLIPVRGKQPAPSKWQDFSYKLPEEEEIDTWQALTGITGYGLILGPISNLCCIDVDEEDPEMLQRILDVLPQSPMVKKGKKGETRFYRMSPTSENPYHKTIEKIKNRLGKVAVEFHFEKRMTVIPPSIHPETGESYVWTDSDIDIATYDIELLPYFDLSVIEICRSVVEDNMTKVQVDVNLPITEGIGATQRHDDMVRFVSDLIRKRTPVDRSIFDMLMRDADRNEHNLYFLDPTKGNRGKCIEANAIKMYGDMLKSINEKKNNDFEVPYIPDFSGKDGWNKIIKDETITVEPMTEDMMPKALWNYCHGYSHRNETAIEYVFSSVIASFCVPLGDRMYFNPKMEGCFKWRPKMSCAIVGNPSVRKSTAINAGVDILVRAQKEMFEVKKDVISAALTAIIDIETKIADLIKRKEKSIALGDEGATEGFNNEIINLKSQHKDICNARIDKNYIINDATIQAVAEKMSKIAGAYFQVYDELAGWLEFIGQKNQASARQQYLELMNQGFRENHKIDRKGKGLSLTVKWGHISLIGTVQPSIFKMFAVRKDGLLQRIHPINPDFVKPEHLIDVKEDKLTTEKVYNVMRNIILNPTSEWAETDPLSKDYFMKFNTESHKILYRYDMYLRDLSAGYDDNMQAYVEKLLSQFYNYCVVFQLFEVYEEGRQDKTISVKSALMAEKLCNVNIQHALKTYSSETIPMLRIKMIKMLKERVEQQITVSTFKQALRTTSFERIFMELSILENMNYIRKSDINMHSNKKNTVYEVNPQILDT